MSRSLFRALQSSEVSAYTCVVFLHQWLYLLKIFEQPELYRRLNQLAFKFESIHNKFKVSSRGCLCA